MSPKRRNMDLLLAMPLNLASERTGKRLYPAQIARRMAKQFYKDVSDLTVRKPSESEIKHVESYITQKVERKGRYPKVAGKNLVRIQFMTTGLKSHITPGTQNWFNGDLSGFDGKLLK